MDMKTAFGLMSLTLIIASDLPYAWSVFKGRTKPHAFSWIIWAMLTAIAYAAQLAKGAGAGAWPTAVSSMSCSAIAIFGLWKGDRIVSRSDWMIFAAALAALPLWYLTADPKWSVALVIAIEGLAYVMTFRKAWSSPWDEMALFYLLNAGALALSLLALRQYNFVTAAYPVSIMCASTILAMLIWRRRYKIVFLSTGSS